LYVRQDADIIVYDATGKKHKSISIPAEVQWSTDFVVIPDKRMAFLDNMHDVIYFVDEHGKYLKTVAIADTPDNELQNMDGVVVDGRLIVSESGHNELVAVDLATYALSVFRSLKHLRGWLGAIAYAEGQYYICQSQDIYSFKPGAPDVTKVATTPAGNITGIVFTQGRLLAVVNGMSRINERSLAAKCRTKNGVLYQIDPTSGEVTLLKDGLNYPEGILLLNSTGKQD